MNLQYRDASLCKTMVGKIFGNDFKKKNNPDCITSGFHSAKLDACTKQENLGMFAKFLCIWIWMISAYYCIKIQNIPLLA